MEQLVVLFMILPVLTALLPLSHFFSLSHLCLIISFLITSLLLFSLLFISFCLFFFYYSFTSTLCYFSVIRDYWYSVSLFEVSVLIRMPGSRVSFSLESGLLKDLVSCEISYIVKLCVVTTEDTSVCNGI
jgi:hypothetical protein